MEVITMLCWICMIFGVGIVLEFVWRSGRRITAGVWPRDMLK